MLRLSAILLLAALSACATPKSLAERELDEWMTVSSPLVDSGVIKKSEYYKTVELIGEKHNISSVVQIGFMLRDQAEKMERGEISKEQFKVLEKRWQNDPRDFAMDAYVYFAFKRRFEPLCASFGNKVGSPEFKKCVYELSQKEIDRLTARPSVIYIPPPVLPQAPRNINCTTVGNTTNCTTF